MPGGEGGGSGGGRGGALLDPVTNKNERISERFRNAEEMECFSFPNFSETFTTGMSYTLGYAMKCALCNDCHSKGK